MDVVAKYTVMCAIASRLPAWWTNSPSVTGLQLKMLAEISSMYEIEFRQDLARPMMGSLVGGGLSFVLSQNPLTMALKVWVVPTPIVGIPLRFATGPAIIGGYCYLLGRAYVDHYEAGGTYHDFNAARLRATVRAALTPAPA